MELINKQDIMDVYCKSCIRSICDETCTDKIRINSVPSFTQSQGTWVDIGDPLLWECSQCRYIVARWNNTPYCPKCGAHMIGVYNE